MVAPFKPTSVYRFRTMKTGPSSSVFTYSYSREGVNQAKPYLDTGLDLVIEESTGPSGINSLYNPIRNDSVVEATNLARKRFVDKLGNTSSFGAALTAELRKTWGTVVNGVVDTYTAARAVKRGDLLKAASILGFSPPVVRKSYISKRKRSRGGRWYKKMGTREFWVMPSGKYVLKSLANKWLWFSYAIKPLVGDIYNGIDVLQRDAPFQKAVRAVGQTHNLRTDTPYEGQVYNYTSDVTVKISGLVTVTNPNLWLANQLGIVNPVQMFNEGIPFSFVVDWFSNLSQMIMQMTDFVGLEIAKPLTISKRIYTERQHLYGPTWNTVNFNKHTVLRRSVEIPDAKLRFAYERFEWQRGLNAISLLVGFLTAVKQ